MKPIDLCIALNGPLVDVLLPLTMGTLMEHNDLSGVEIYFIDKGISEPVRRYLDGLAESTGCPVHVVMHDRIDMGDSRKVVRDVADTLKWIVEECGVNEWVFISHFDLECRGPLLDYYRGLIDEKTGQIGAHNTGIVGYRREAVKACDLGFWGMDDCYLVRDRFTNDRKIRHTDDPRCNDRSVQISGWDIGELLELGLLYKGWAVRSEYEEELQRLRIHNGSGCGRCEGANAMIRERALDDLARRGMEPIR